MLTLDDEYAKADDVYRGANALLIPMLCAHDPRFKDDWQHIVYLLDEMIGKARALRDKIAAMGEW